MTTKELLISRLNLLSDEDIASLLDAAIRMGEKNTLAAPIAALIPSSVTDINAENRGFSANPVERHLSRPPIQHTNMTMPGTSLRTAGQGTHMTPSTGRRGRRPLTAMYR